MKIECIGLKLDRGQSSGRGGKVMGRAAQGGGQVAHSRVYLGPTLSYMVLRSLFPKFCDFHDRIPF
jgi:hypothetical protein